jgi:hypothetical protein
MVFVANNHLQHGLAALKLLLNYFALLLALSVLPWADLYRTANALHRQRRSVRGPLMYCSDVGKHAVHEITPYVSRQAWMATEGDMLHQVNAADASPTASTGADPYECIHAPFHVAPEKTRAIAPQSCDDETTEATFVLWQALMATEQDTLHLVNAADATPTSHAAAAALLDSFQDPHLNIQRHVLQRHGSAMLLDLLGRFVSATAADVVVMGSASLSKCAFRAAYQCKVVCAANRLISDRSVRC